MMKKIFITLGVMTLAIASYAQDVAKNDSIMDLIVDRLDNVAYDVTLRDRYKLYPTDNIYNFLKLDTATGQIYQVQWSLKKENEGTIILNFINLAPFSEARVGTFELYPTKNMYQFLLLNKTTGSMWHVQWGMKDSERWIKPIY